MTRSPHKIFTDHLSFLDTIQIESNYGYVSAISGLMLEGSGLANESSIGTQCSIQTNQHKNIKAQIVGFKNGKALLMAFGPLDGVGIGSKITITQSKSYLFPDQHWLGRVINAFGDPIDELGPLPQGTEPIPLLNTPPPAHQRKRVHRRIDLGVKALNTFIPACEGQRLGIFAGSGVGKSMLMSMLARYTEADVNVIGLVGERGREVQEFLYDDLGEEGLKKSVLVVATSDESPLMRRQAAYTTLAVAEYFRNQGKHVLCIIDNITRFAMAQREIGLSVGEPPTTKGYPPSVYSELPRLLERAGPGLKDQGSITGFFTVLVEGDDFNEPISDTVRGILDGHIILDRKIADRGRYPSIHVLKSISRMLPDCHSDEENELLRIAKKYLSLYEDMSEMIRLGAYRKGSDPDVDKAILYYNDLEDFLTQNYTTYISQQDAFQALSEIIQKYEE